MKSAHEAKNQTFIIKEKSIDPHVRNINDKIDPYTDQIDKNMKQLSPLQSITFDTQVVDTNQSEQINGTYNDMDL